MLKFPALTTRLYKLEKKLLSLQQFKDGEVTETIPSTTPTLNEGTPTRVMLRESTILNPGESINERIRLPDMSKIGIGSPRTKRKGNLME